MKADLHVHSTASDGTLSPSQLIALALRRGVDVLAIADHDSVSGLSEAFAAAQNTPLTLIPAVELSASADDYDVHILAYYVDPSSAPLLEELRLLRAGRERRAAQIVEALRAGGIPVTMEHVLAFSSGGAVGRSHIARALVSTGHAESIASAFEFYIGRGRDYYRSKPSRTPEEVVSSVRALGAIPVLAHPGVTAADELIPSMVASGLLGIEAYHADHTSEQRNRYERMAADFGLITTGGTDYHGPLAHNPQLGSVDVPEASVRALLRLDPGARSGTAVVAPA
ncbi:MAG: PHP domain-containing protein [Coriobacteriia bacterium]